VKDAEAIFFGLAVRRAYLDDASASAGAAGVVRL